jgi:hypothetical protein
MKNLDSWPRLAGAAADARDALRAVIPRLDSAIAAGADSTGLLAAVRLLAWKHADALRLALKAPQGSQRSRKSADSWRSGGLWAILEASEGVGQRKPAPGPHDG